jgi:hypothetical protein
MMVTRISFAFTPSSLGSKSLIFINSSWFCIHAPFKGTGSILFLKNGLKKFTEKDYKKSSQKK